MALRRFAKDTLKHGLVTQRVLDQLRRVGIGLSPYFLFREAVRPDQIDRPDLTCAS